MGKFTILKKLGLPILVYSNPLHLEGFRYRIHKWLPLLSLIANLGARQEAVWPKLRGWLWSLFQQNKMSCTHLWFLWSQSVLLLHSYWLKALGQVSSENSHIPYLSLESGSLKTHWFSYLSSNVGGSFWLAQTCHSKTSYSQRWFYDILSKNNLGLAWLSDREYEATKLLQVTILRQIRSSTIPYLFKLNH